MKRHVLDTKRPLAITMWEFSWLERRWPGAGYEDWDQALEELAERGYDAIRIDPFPHLLAKDPDREWLLHPVWSVQDWGSRSINKVVVAPNLKAFLERCRAHNILVALSTWFRVDEDKTLMEIKTPRDHAEIWKKTLDLIGEWGLLDTILYVDLCNEFPLDCWAPFFTKAAGGTEVARDSAFCASWMRESVAALKACYPEIPMCYSFVAPFDDPDEDASAFDLLEPHVWMAQSSNYYELVGYQYERFESTGYDNLMLRGETIYREQEAYWKECLRENIQKVALWAEKSGKPLVTTECWSVVDYKDWPLLSWDWVKDLCEFGVREALKTGKWAAVATSNFCGPQFHGMWRDVEWHRRLTGLIHNPERAAEEVAP